MKILDLTQSYAATSGGVRTFIHAQREHLLGGGHEHVLVVPGEEDAARREGASATYTVRSPLVPGSRVYRLLLRSGAVRRILAEERPDVVATYCAYNLPWAAFRHREAHPRTAVVAYYMTDLPTAYVATPLSKRLGAPLGRAAGALAEGYVRRLYRGMEATVAISPALGARLGEMGVENVHTVPLGADLEVFHPRRRDPAIRARFGVGDGDLLLVYAGRLDGEKRAALVLEAFARLPARLRATLVLVGEGPLRAALAARAAEIGRAHVLPFLSDRVELAALLASADLYVTAMPFETFGLSVVEAQACGLPVVGVAGGAMVDRVPPGSGVGRLGAVDSVEEMTENVTAMADEGVAAAGRRARAMVEAHFSWARTFERVFELYDAVLARRGAAAR